MSAPSASRIQSQNPMESIVERVARFVGADGIAVLAVPPATAPRDQDPVPVAIYGGLSYPALNIERLFPEGAHGARYTRLPPAFGEELGVGSNALCLASPFGGDEGESVAGVVVVVFIDDAGTYERAKAAADLLVATVALELGRRSVLEELANARALSARHVQCRDQERHRLASEIHDDLSQNVTYIRLALTSLERQLDAARLEQARTEIKDLVKAAGEVKDCVQKLSSALRPAMIETLGPLPAIRNEAKLHKESTGVVVQCDLEDEEVPAPVSMAIFRIVQESLSNIARHASASEVGIRLARRGESTLLSVEDNGCGFVFDEHRHGLGIMSMIERAEIAGGTLAIETNPGEGTVVRATFPTKTTTGIQPGE